MVQFHKNRFESSRPDNELQSMIIHFVGAHCTDATHGKDLLSILGFFRHEPKKGDQDDGMSFYDMTPRQIAKQLFIIDHSYFRKIPLYEFLDRNFLKSMGDHSEIRKFCKWFNKFSCFVSSSILQTTLTTNRTKLINRFIVMAYKCMEIRDFSASMAIVSGLQCASIKRLRASWHNITVKSLNMYNELDHLYSMNHNFHNYREHLNNINGSRFIPILAVIERDLIHIEEGNNKFFSSQNIINFERCSMISEQLLMIFNCQNCTVPYIPFSNFQIQFDEINLLDEDEMWDISKLLEPYDEVKNIPAPVFSKRKAILEFGNHIRGDFKEAIQDLRETKNEIENNYESLLQSFSPRRNLTPSSSSPKLSDKKRKFTRSKSLTNSRDGYDLLTPVSRFDTKDVQDKHKEIMGQRKRKSCSERLDDGTIKKMYQKSSTTSDLSVSTTSRSGSRLLPPPLRVDSPLVTSPPKLSSRRRSLPLREDFQLPPDSFQREDESAGDVFCALLDYASENGVLPTESN